MQSGDVLVSHARSLLSHTGCRSRVRTAISSNHISQLNKSVAKLPHVRQLQREVEVTRREQRNAASHHDRLDIDLDRVDQLLFRERRVQDGPSGSAPPGHRAPESAEPTPERFRERQVRWSWSCFASSRDLRTHSGDVERVAQVALEVLHVDGPETRVRQHRLRVFLTHIAPGPAPPCASDTVRWLNDTGR